MARQSLVDVIKMIDNTLGEVPVEAQFLMDLNRSIELTDKKNSRKSSQTFKPSQMNCMRASYYTIKGIPQDETKMESPFIGICESGTDRHIRIQTAISLMIENGIDCEYIDVAEYIKQKKLKDIKVVSQQGMETKLFHKKYNISFLCDGIIRYKGEYYILEIKTESSRKFFERSGVDPSHHQQAIAYSLAFDISKVMFIYENRDVCSKKAFLFEVTDDMKQDLIGYMENTNTYLKENKVPPKLRGRNDVERKTCDYCQYKGQCRKDG